MSTRAQIVFTGLGLYSNDETYRLYLSCDGYPSAVLDTLKDAMARAVKQTKENNKRFKEKRPVFTSQLCGLFIGEDTSAYGMSVRLEHETKLPFNKEVDIVTAFDIEWTYVVDLHKNEVSVFKGTYANMIVDPCIYAKQLHEEYRKDRVKTIKSQVSALKKLGLKVNK